MNCTEVKERLSAYYDAELSPDESTQVANHLDVCDDCAQQRHRFPALTSGVRQRGAAPPPSEIWRQVEEHLDAQPEAVPIERGTQPEKRWAAWPQWATCPLTGEELPCERC